ncbi:hypothetical protein CHS0354_009881 [Potamilus streckersoni]|uniref:Uncharacterized protein n=1 Tax=Potamilus streckersoni TaxID=2493646 RepID=A0AAE0S4H8_9BIVA|nr:hypothetical protein CHS0354_009881 [Potamilus streckersoni]
MKDSLRVIQDNLDSFTRAPYATINARNKTEEYKAYKAAYNTKTRTTCKTPYDH